MRMRRFRWLWLAALCVACAPDAWRDWRSAYDRDHPLAGRIFDLRARESLAPDELVRRLAGARFVLLGEKHDNPDHHRLQAWLIQQLAARGQRRAVAFEMLGLDVGAALAEQLARAPEDVDGIARAVGWEKSGWPDWALYRPVFAVAIAAAYPIVAADLARAELAKLRSGGPADAALLSLGLDQPLAPDLLASLESDLLRSHCGALPRSALARVVAIQRARDARLAASLSSSAAADGAVLIAGAGHVDGRWAVPSYLSRAAPGSSVVSLALAEVDPGKLTPGDYLEPAPPFDFLWLTPRSDETDPCERFREQLRGLNPAPAS